MSSSISVTASSVVSNFFSITSASSSAKRGTNSLGLMIARLPAAIAATAGAKVSCSG